MSARSVILVDNRDSFTFNLVDSLRRLGAEVAAYRNLVPAGRLLDLALAEKALIVLSPGPGRPADAGCCLELVAVAKGKVPVLGVCLGLQAIGEEAGVEVMQAAQPVHGQASTLVHDAAGPLAGLPQPLRIGRYHSLCLSALPERFVVHAQLDGMVMAASDAESGQVGLQFHPESILTPHGDRILVNVLEMSERFYDARSA